MLRVYNVYIELSLLYREYTYSVCCALFSQPSPLFQKIEASTLEVFRKQFAGESAAAGKASAQVRSCISTFNMFK